LPVLRPTLGLAFREIRRARLRFGLLAGALGLLAFLVLFQQTLLTSLLGYFTGALENQSAEVLVYGEEARTSVEASVVLPPTVEAVGGVEGVGASAPLGENTFTAEVGGSLEDVVVFGYELGGPGAPTTLVEGRLPERDGEGVASDLDVDLGLAIGDVVLLGPEGEVPIEIVGLASDLRFSVEPTVFTSFATFAAGRQAVNPDAPLVPASLVAVEPADGVDPATLANRINAEVDGVEALTRAEAVSQAPGVAETRQSFNIVFLLAYVVVAIVTAFFFLILTIQKQGAFTLLRAIGASGGVLAGAVMVQALVVTLVGIALGAGTTALVAVLVDDDFAQVPDPGLVLSTGTTIVVLAAIAALPSLRRVRRLEPADAAQPTGGLT
jgi:putative ABC transport system permease protein